MSAGYHIGFGADAIAGVEIALLSGDPDRARRIATEHLELERPLSTRRGLHSFIARTPGGLRVVSATSGMGAPSTSIVVNELAQAGIRHIVRVGTSGSIQPHVRAGSVVISRAALCRQGAADDVAPRGFPAAASPFWTLALVEAAQRQGADWHVGITASVDTFFEGQERTDTSFNKTLRRSLRGTIEAYRALRVLNVEMEAGTLFKQAAVYGLGVGCVCAIIAERTRAESVDPEVVARTEALAISTAIEAIDTIEPRWLAPHCRW